MRREKIGTTLMIYRTRCPHKDGRTCEDQRGDSREREKRRQQRNHSPTLLLRHCKR